MDHFTQFLYHARQTWLIHYSGKMSSVAKHLSPCDERCHDWTIHISNSELATCAANDPMTTLQLSFAARHFPGLVCISDHRCCVLEILLIYCSVQHHEISCRSGCVDRREAQSSALTSFSMDKGVVTEPYLHSKLQNTSSAVQRHPHSRTAHRAFAEPHGGVSNPQCSQSVATTKSAVLRQGCSHLFTTLPCLSIRNLEKFHLMSLNSTPPCCVFMYLYTGSAAP